MSHAIPYPQSADSFRRTRQQHFANEWSWDRLIQRESIACEKGMGKIMGAFAGASLAAGAGFTLGLIIATTLLNDADPLITVAAAFALVLGIVGGAIGAAIGSRLEMFFENESAERTADASAYAGD